MSDTHPDHSSEVDLMANLERSLEVCGARIQMGMGVLGVHQTCARPVGHAGSHSALISQSARSQCEYERDSEHFRTCTAPHRFVVARADGDLTYSGGPRARCLLRLRGASRRCRGRDGRRRQREPHGGDSVRRGEELMPSQGDYRSEPGRVTWRCPACGTERDGDAEMIEGNLDPAAIGESDRCPSCHLLDGECIDWRPDTPEGYRLWVEAAEIAT